MAGREVLVGQGYLLELQRYVQERVLARDLKTSSASAL